MGGMARAWHTAKSRSFSISAVSSQLGDDAPALGSELTQPLLQIPIAGLQPALLLEQPTRLRLGRCELRANGGELAIEGLPLDLT